jgi:hypothetical protein
MNELTQITRASVFVRVASQQRLFEQGQTAKDTLLCSNAVAFKGYFFCLKNITASAKLYPGWITSTPFSKFKDTGILA